MSSIEWSWNLCLPSTDLFKCVTDMQLLSVDDSVGKSRHILGSMNQRMSQHKWIILTVIAVLVLAIALIVYVKMHSKRSWCSFCSLSLCRYVVYLSLLNRSRNQVNWDRLNSCAELALQVYNSWRPVSQHHLDKSWHSTWCTQLHNLGGFMVLSCSTLNHIWVPSSEHTASSALPILCHEQWKAPAEELKLPVLSPTPIRTPPIAILANPKFSYKVSTATSYWDCAACNSRCLNGWIDFTDCWWGEKILTIGACE